MADAFVLCVLDPLFEDIYQNMIRYCRFISFSAHDMVFQKSMLVILAYILQDDDFYYFQNCSCSRSMMIRDWASLQLFLLCCTAYTMRAAHLVFFSSSI